LVPHFVYVVNIQGDEPLIEPDIRDGVVMSLQRDRQRHRRQI